MLANLEKAVFNVMIDYVTMPRSDLRVTLEDYT
jgi:hypothetical protein